MKRKRCQENTTSSENSTSSALRAKHTQAHTASDHQGRQRGLPETRHGECKQTGDTVATHLSLCCERVPAAETQRRRHFPPGTWAVLRIAWRSKSAARHASVPSHGSRQLLCGLNHVKGGVRPPQCGRSRAPSFLRRPCLSQSPGFLVFIVHCVNAGVGGDMRLIKRVQ